MIEFLRNLFKTDFMPHGYCIRQPEVIWLHETSDLVIALSYFLIPMALVYFVRTRRDLVYPWIIWLFGLFIVSCGATHLLAIYVLWHPVYRLEGVVKAITALASFPTALLLIRLVPKARLLPSPAQLRQQNTALEAEVSERKHAEAEVRRLNTELEVRVAERTEELQRSNIELRRVNEDLRHTQQALARQLTLISGITTNATTSLFITDEKQQCVFMNPAAEQLSGYKLEEVRDRSLHELVHHTRPNGSRYPSEECPIHCAFSEHSRKLGEETFIHKDGRFYDVAFSASVMQEGPGAWGTVIEIVDITERKRKEAERRGTERLLNAVLDALPVSIIIAGRDGRLVRKNQASERIWGLTAPMSANVEGYGEWVGYWPGTERRVGPHEWPLSRALLYGEVTADERVEIERFGDGKRLVVELSAAPIREESGDILGGVIASMDVTERVRAEEAVRASEATLSAILDALPVGVVIADKNGRIVRDNPANRELWGAPPATSSWQQYAEWVGYWPQTGERIKAHEWAMSRALLQGEVTKGELVECEQFGTKKRRCYMNNAAPVFDAAGKIIAGVVAEMDVTEQRRAEGALRDSEIRFRTLVEQASDAFLVHDFQGRIVDANRQACASLGYSSEELLCMNVLDVETDLDLSQAQEVWRRIQPEEAHTTYGRYRRKDGTVFPIEGRLSRCELGGQRLYLGLIRDITERKRAEEAILESEARFRQLADSMPQMVWTARPDGYVDYYNERWYEFTGFDRSLAEDQSWEPLLHADEVQLSRDAWYSSIKEGQPYRIEYRFWDRQHGCWRWFMGRALPARNEFGQIVKWFGTCTDIDEQKRVEAELRRANHDLEQFAYAASHDLQEPLRNVALCSQILKDRYGSKLDGQADEFLGHLVEGALRMGNLVADLRAFTQAGSLDNEPVTPAKAEQVFEEVLRDLHRAIEESTAAVTHDVLPLVAVQAIHLRQLLQNLIGNALKYRNESEPPRVHISAREQNGFWQFSVEDNGIGIAPQYHKRIFGIFKRLHGRTGKYPGTGIGLAICQKIVERYGGRIWVESELGLGTTFYFLLPAVRAVNE